MTPIITEHDRKMMDEAAKWMYIGADDKYHLREDAPIEVKKHHERMKKIYGMFQ